MYNKYFSCLWLAPLWLACPTEPPCEAPCIEVEPSVEKPQFDDTCWGRTYNETSPLPTLETTDCLEAIKLDTDFPLLGSAGEMQVHLDADFDGQRLYLAYNTANTETEAMGIHGRTLACDGTLGDEVTISQEQSLFTDPQIAAGASDIMVLWQRDEADLGPNNLDLFAQPYTKAYEPLTEDNILLEMKREGAPEVKNAWMASVVPARMGVYWAFGSRGHSQATTFQTFGQLLDSTGQTLCDSIDLNLAPEIGQVYPVSDAKGDRVLIAWEATLDQGTEIEYILSEGGLLHLATPDLTNVQGDAQRPAVALNHDGEQGALAFFVQSGSISKVLLMDPLQPTNVIQVGRSDKIAHSPAVALGKNGGVILWLENISGTKNNAYFQPFQWQEDRYVLLGVPTPITSEKVLPYAPLVLHLDDDHYFLGWMAGDYPNYQAYGRFIGPSELQ